MKKTITLSIATVVAMGLMSFSILHDDGHDVDHTGGHGEPDCTEAGCHTDNAVNTGNGSISITTSPSVASGYIPGATYTINVTITKALQSAIGFDFEALGTTSGIDAGSFTNITSETQILPGIVTNVVHDGAAPGSGSHTFSFEWIAPATSTGDVTFYASGNAGDGDGWFTADYIYTTSLNLVEGTPGALSATVVGTDVTCNAASDGSATVTASGGTPPYSYSWAPNGGSSDVAVGLDAGTYTCIVTDGAGGTFTTTVTITEPAVLTVSSSWMNVECFGGTGNATVTPIGGTAPYTYLWTTSPAPQTTAFAHSLTAGTYTCTISDGSGCTTSEVVTITQPTTALSVVMSSTDETVAGNGTATATVSGGTPPYSYVWSDATNQTTQTAIGLVGGVYFVEITDGNGCTTNDSTFVSSTVGITSSDLPASVKIYPNPSKDDFSVEINAVTATTYTLNVINALGQIVKTEMIEVSEGKNLVPLSLDATFHGMFTVQVISNQGVMTIPVTKLK